MHHSADDGDGHGMIDGTGRGWGWSVRERFHSCDGYGSGHGDGFGDEDCFGDGSGDSYNSICGYYTTDDTDGMGDGCVSYGEIDGTGYDHDEDNIEGDSDDEH